MILPTEQVYNTPTRPPHMPHKPKTHRPNRNARARDQRPSAALRGYGHAWRKLRALILAERPLCEAPGCNRPAKDVDHRVARAKGGTDDESNLVAYCHSCHSKKTVAEDNGFGRRTA